jgi:hypothetical protein
MSLWRPALHVSLLRFRNSWTDSWFGCIKRLHLWFILLIHVICVMISWWFCCIYAWLDPGAYMIARFMSFINRVWHLPCLNKQRIDCWLANNETNLRPVWMLGNGLNWNHFSWGGLSHYKKSVNPWWLNFIIDHWKTFIKQYPGWSQISPCMERHRLHRVTF